MLVAYGVKNPLMRFNYKIVNFNLESNLLKIQILKGNFTIEKDKLYEFTLEFNGKSLKVLAKPLAFFGKNATFKVLNVFENRRRFPRFDVNLLNLFVELETQRGERIPAKAVDFSLGGIRLKFTARNYTKVKNALSGNPWEDCSLLFSVRRDAVSHEELKVSALPVRFDDKNRTVSFLFLFTAENSSVLKLYDYVISELKKFEGAEKTFPEFRFTELRKEDKDIYEAIKRADGKLYRAKRKGKNRVEV